jgi:hypothetical protein
MGSPDVVSKGLLLLLLSDLLILETAKEGAG